MPAGFFFYQHISGGKMSGLLLKNLSKIYPGGHAAVKEFSLEIKNGEFLVLAGPTGCGKSTLLRMIAGLEDISYGCMYIDGKDMTNADTRERNIAMLFRNSVLYPNMSVADNLTFALRMGKMPQNEIDARLKETASVLGLEAILEKTSADLNLEETYRALLGRAVMRRPGILLLDSTIANLAESSQQIVRREFYEFHKKMKMTVIYVTDNQKTAMALGSRMVVMNDGAIVQVDTPNNLMIKPANCFVARSVGRPPMSLYTASVFGEENTVGLMSPGGTILLPEKKGNLLARRAYFGKEIIFGLRADALHLVKEDQPEDGTLTAKFQGVESSMDGQMIKFMIGEAEGTCLSEQVPSCSVGGEIHLSVDADRIYLFDKETGKTILNE